MAYKVFTNGSTLQASELNENLMQQSIAVFSNATARSAALTSPVEGQVTYLEDSNSYQYWNNGWIGLVPQSANAVINGGFDIWQRGTSASLALGFLGADRWKHDFVSAVQTGTASRQSFTPGELDSFGVSGNEFFQRITCSNNNGSTQHVFFNNIEDVRTFAGQTVTMSFYAKAASAVTLQTRIAQLFGTGGSSPFTTSFVSHSLTTNWQRFTVQIAIPTVSGKTIGAGSSLRFDFSLPLSTYTIDIWGVQLEAGSVATPFKRNATSLQGELAACQRYYYRANAENAFGRMGFGMAQSTTTGQIHVKSPVTMRIAPTSIDFPTVSTLRVSDIASGQALSSLSLLGQSTTNDLAATFTVASGLNSFRPYFLEGNNSSAAFIGFSAEL